MGKLIFLFLTTIMFWFSNLYSGTNNCTIDSVTITANPEHLEIDNDGIIKLSIENNSSDTLLIVNEFYLQGLEDEILVYPMFYSPNIIVMKKAE